MGIITNIIILAIIAIIAVGCARFAFKRGVASGIETGRQQVLKEDLMRLEGEHKNIAKQIKLAIQSIQPNGY